LSARKAIRENDLDQLMHLPFGIAAGDPASRHASREA
jgi:hypothetical protein